MTKPQDTKPGTAARPQNHATRHAPRVTDFRVYLITDRKQVSAGHTLASAVEAALKGGVKAVQLREKDLSDAELLPIARGMRALTHAHQAKLMINDRVDIALEVGADGVHLGGHSMATRLVREKIGPDMLIGVSTHSEADIRRAAAEGADFVTFGPVYFTPSKAGYGAPQGLSALQQACRNSPLPIFALGGITAERAADCLQAGARGVALISAIIASPDPQSATRSFLA